MSSNEPRPPRSVSPRPKSGKPRQFKLPVSKQKEKSSNSLQWMIAAIVVLAVGAVAAHMKAQAPDPHYVKAHDAVAAYEQNVPYAAREFDNPVYSEALAELKLVNPGSASARPAAELSDRIQRELLAYLERLRKRDQEREALKEDRGRRTVGVADALQQTNAFFREYQVDPSGPICREPDGSIHQEGEQHAHAEAAAEQPTGGNISIPAPEHHHH